MQLLTVSLGLVNVHVPVEGFKGFKPLKPFAYPYPYPSKPLPSLALGRAGCLCPCVGCHRMQLLLGDNNGGLQDAL